MSSVRRFCQHVSPGHENRFLALRGSHRRRHHLPSGRKTWVRVGWLDTTAWTPRTNSFYELDLEVQPPTGASGEILVFTTFITKRNVVPWFLRFSQVFPCFPRTSHVFAVLNFLNLKNSQNFLAKKIQKDTLSRTHLGQGSTLHLVNYSLYSMLWSMCVCAWYLDPPKYPPKWCFTSCVEHFYF
jgi:hypothetical protein